MRSFHVKNDRLLVLFLLNISALAAQNTSFNPPVNYPLAGGAGREIVADFNRDGILDIVAISANNSFAYFQGKGDGTFLAPVFYSMSGATGASPGALAAADFNRDGNLDIVVVHPTSTSQPNGFGNQFTVHLGDGKGHFQTPGLDFTTGGSDISITVGDFNGDGNPDLAIGSWDSQEIFIHLGNGDGTFKAGPAIRPEPLCSGFIMTALAVADVNKDGHLDIISANRACGTISVMLGNGSGSFASPQLFGTDTSPETLVIADLNNDGNLDVATGNDTTSISVLLGNGQGSFRLSGNFVATGGLKGSITAADFNGDGKVDLAIVDANNNVVSVFPGSGTGQFSARLDFIVGTGYGGAFGDFNGDGLPDVVVPNTAAAALSVLINNTHVFPGSPSITTSSPLPAGTAGATYSQAFAATGGTPPYTIWTITGGTQPSGLKLSSGGVLSGTPTTPGTYNFTVQVIDSITNSSSASFQLTINAVVCTYTLTPPSAVVPYTGFSGSTGIIATCPFSVISNNPDWIMITGTTANSISYTASANNTGAPRPGSFSVLDANNAVAATFTIMQGTAPCSSLAVSPGNANFGTAGGAGTAMFNTSPCSWSATSSDPSWVKFGTAATLSGSGPSFTFNVSPVGVGTPAIGPTRSATVTVNGSLKIVVTQQAAQICTYTIATSAQDNTTTKTFPPTGGIRTGGVNVTTQAGCPWSPQLNGSLLALTNGGPGSGSGTMGYTVAANTSGSAQTQTINIAGLLYVIKVASAPQTYAAVVSAAVPPAIRAEGKSELTSDVIVNMSGTSVPGGVMGDVIVTFNTTVTNHVLLTDPTGQTTDALLLVGEPSPQALALNANAFRGMIAGPNAIRFRNVPLVPVGNSAFTLTLRVTNLRVDASQSALGNVQATVSMVAPAPISITNATQKVATVQAGNVFAGPTWPGGVSGPSTVPLQFQEGFATAFRPRLASNQDPSQPGIGYNSESGFVNTRVLGVETGLANTATRLVARFSNIPAGVTLYAPVGPASGTNAQLVSADINGVGGSPVSGNAVINGASYQTLTVIAGAATATWEITASNPTAIEILTFNMVVSNPLGVNLSGIQTGGSLGGQIGVSGPSATAPVPRFVPPVAPTPIKLTIAPLITSTGGSGAVSLIRGSRNSPAVYRAASGGVVLGGTVTITEILTNYDTQAATNVVVGGSLPPTALFIECAASDGGGSCALSGNSMRVTYPSIGAGQIATIRLRAAFPKAGDLAEFNANVTSDSPLASLGNGSYTANFATNPAPVLSITSSHSPAIFQPGGIGTYTILVTNNGAAPTPPDDPIIVTDTLPTGFTLQSMVGGVGWSCTGNTCQLSGSLLVNSSAAPIYVTTKLPVAALTPAVNVASVSGGGAAPASTSDAGTFQCLGLSCGSTTGYAFYPVTPCRVVDTRSYGGKTGAFGPPFLAGGVSRDFPIPAGSCNIPSTAGAYSLNVTVFPHKPLGYLSVWPAGLPFPVVSTLNSFDGAVVANAAIVPAGTNGSITVLASDDTDVFIDINGYFADPSLGGLAFYPVTPCRVADTRPYGGKTGAFGPPSMSPFSIRTFPVPSSTCGIPASAQAYSLNMTAWPPTALQWLTTWPAGQGEPVVSTLNDYQGGIVANAAIVPAGTNGSINVFVTDQTDVFFDINGYFAPPGPGGLYFYPMTPCRIADTRSYGGKTGALGPPSLAGGKSRDFPVASACGVPASAQAYSLNMTVWPPAAMQFLTTWPAGQPQPVVSTLNAVTGRVTANAAIVPAGANGSISVFVSDPTDLFFDINGIFAP